MEQQKVSFNRAKSAFIAEVVENIDGGLIFKEKEILQGDNELTPEETYESFSNVRDFHPIRTRKTSICELLARINLEIIDGKSSIIKCKTCGKYFFIPSSELAFYEEKNLHTPKNCKACRLKIKEQIQNNKKSDNVKKKKYNKNRNYRKKTEE
jgi:hypothetical protein